MKSIEKTKRLQYIVNKYKKLLSYYKGEIGCVANKVETEAVLVLRAEIALLTRKNKSNESSIQRFIKHIDNLRIEIGALSKERNELLKKIRNLECAKESCSKAIAEDKYAHLEELRVKASIGNVPMRHKEKDQEQLIGKMKVIQELNAVQEDIRKLSSIANKDSKKFINKMETNFKKLQLEILKLPNTEQEESKHLVEGTAAQIRSNDSSMEQGHKTMEKMSRLNTQESPKPLKEGEILRRRREFNGKHPTRKFSTSNRHKAITPVFMTEGDLDIAEEESIGFKLNHLEFVTNTKSLGRLKENDTRNCSKLKSPAVNVANTSLVRRLNSTYFK